MCVCACVCVCIHARVRVHLQVRTCVPARTCVHEHLYSLFAYQTRLGEGRISSMKLNANWIRTIQND